MAQLVRINRKDIAALLLGVTALWLSKAAFGDAGERVTVLVAAPGFNDAQYQKSVVVLQRGGNEEVGVIINRPTEHELASVVAAPAAEKAADPVYAGGPFLPQQLLALIRDEKSPGEGSMQLTHGLHLAIGQGVLERAVERAPGTARFYAGLILWRPGELSDEMRRGLWLKLEVPLDTVFRRDSAGLWEELLLAAQALRA